MSFNNKRFKSSSPSPEHQISENKNLASVGWVCISCLLALIHSFPGLVVGIDR